MAPRLPSHPVELDTPQQAVDWLRARVKGKLETDSRRVGAGDAFIAWPGAATDGRRYVPDALAQGATACLVEREGLSGLADARVAAYAQLKAATGPIAAAYYGNPSARMTLLAVTGTNGKTSVSWWIAQALASRQTPQRCAVVGTLGIGEPPQLAFNGLTTPDPVLLQRSLRELVDGGVSTCAIEASSIGLAERRLDGCQFRVALFTNFSHDHLDYHGSMEAYWQAKAELFSWPGLQAAVVNVDDAQGVDLAARLGQTALDLWTYSASGASAARLRASAVHYADHAAQYGLCFELSEAGDAQPYSVRSGLIGQYNVANLLAVIGGLRALGVSLAEAADLCAGLRAVPGRMECISLPGQPLAVVDYAHTPDALDQALAGLRALAQQRGGQLWCLFGCGGDRDASKRPVMAALAEKNADQVMVTSDNPRFEKPQAIISQMLLGLSHGHGAQDHVHVEPDRALAIAQVLAQAKPEDVVLIAGKGHEDYQDIAGQKLPFSDQAQARAALALRREGGA